MAMGRWGQEMWLSDRDFLEGIKAAVVAEGVLFAALNLMSNNPGMRWDMRETKDAIGFEPQDGARPTMTIKLGFQARLKKLVRFSLPRWFEKRFPSW